MGLLRQEHIAVAGEGIIFTLEKYVLVSVYSAALFPEGTQAAISKATEVAIKAELPIVVHPETPVNQHSAVVDYYYLATFLSASSFRNKLALVFPKAMHHNKLDFFETTAKNRSIDVEIFSTIEEAENWISGT